MRLVGSCGFAGLLTAGKGGGVNGNGDGDGNGNGNGNGNGMAAGYPGRYLPTNLLAHFYYREFRLRWLNLPPPTTTRHARRLPDCPQRQRPSEVAAPRRCEVGRGSWARWAPTHSLYY